MIAKIHKFHAKLETKRSMICWDDLPFSFSHTHGQNNLILITYQINHLIFLKFLLNYYKNFYIYTVIKSTLN